MNGWIILFHKINIKNEKGDKMFKWLLQYMAEPVFTNSTHSTCGYIFIC